MGDKRLFDLLRVLEQNPRSAQKKAIVPKDQAWGESL